MNNDYRGFNAVTDVLSFPAIEWSGGKAGQIDTLPVPLDINPETGRILLGDIVLCLAQAVEQAHSYGHSLERELCFLMVHGVLHLLGFDHAEETDDQGMQELTESILSESGMVRANPVVQREQR